MRNRVFVIVFVVMLVVPQSGFGQTTGAAGLQRTPDGREFVVYSVQRTLVVDTPGDLELPPITANVPVEGTFTCLSLILLINQIFTMYLGILETLLVECIIILLTFIQLIFFHHQGYFL